MKKPFLLFVCFFATVASMAQLQRSTPGIVQKPAIPQNNSNIESFTGVKDTLGQNFESYTDFNLDFNPWKTVDVDGFPTYGIEGYSFLHSGEAMSFIVFNPGSSTPSLLDDPDILPHGGVRYAACFASQTHPNNDWIISPLIELGTSGHLKFWIKSYTSNYGLERYKVGVSTTTNEPASFTFISGGNYLEAPASAWEQKDFDLSAYAGMDIYIGIQCVSDNAFILMIDDIEIISGPAGVGEAAWEKEVIISPNPVKEVLHIISGVNIRAVSLVDLNGSEKLRKNDCGNNCTIEPGNIAEGIYILRLDTENGMMQRKVSVVR